MKKKQENLFYIEPEFLRAVKDAQKWLQKSTGKKGFFDPIPMMQHRALYNIVFGERANGKTFAAQLIALVRYVTYGELFCVIRRWDEDFKPKNAGRFFGGLEKTGLIKYLTGGNWDHIYTRSRMFYLAAWDDEGKEIRDSQPIGYGFALTQMEHDKGGTYPPNITTGIFDEFITRSIYVPDEFILFSNVVSTIIRDDGRCIFWMLGNTVSKYCPYFREMGLKHIREMEQGSTSLYKDGSGRALTCVHYADGLPDGKETDRYFAFDNPKLQMITAGDFETANFPHLPREYQTAEICFTFFIDFDGEKLRGDVIRSDSGEEWIYFTPKTTDFKFPDDELIFSDRYDPRPNWRRRITRPATPAEKALLDLIRAEKVFYCDNTCGESVRTYLQWCGSEKIV